MKQMDPALLRELIAVLQSGGIEDDLFVFILNRQLFVLSAVDHRIDQRRHVREVRFCASGAFGGKACVRIFRDGSHAVCVHQLAKVVGAELLRRAEFQLYRSRIQKGAFFLYRKL